MIQIISCIILAFMVKFVCKDRKPNMSHYITTQYVKRVLMLYTKFTMLFDLYVTPPHSVLPSHYVKNNPAAGFCCKPNKIPFLGA